MAEERAAVPFPLNRRRMLWAGGRLAAALGAILVAPPRSLGADPPLDLTYAVAVAGVAVAQVQIDLRATESQLEARFEARPRGLLAMLRQASFEMAASVGRTADGPVPESFRSHQVKPDRVRDISIRYGPTGAIREFTYINNGNRSSSDVPEPLRHGTVDPLTAFLRLRHWVGQVAAAGAPSTLVVPVFDGRKRLDIEAAYLGRDAIAWQGQERPVHVLSVVARARFGYEPGDLLITFPDGSGNGTLMVGMAADEPHVPLRIESVDASIPTTVELLTP
jgi:hypothetical protein